jgi:hypothetical protein
MLYIYGLSLAKGTGEGASQSWGFRQLGLSPGELGEVEGVTAGITLEDGSLGRGLVAPGIRHRIKLHMEVGGASGSSGGVVAVVDIDPVSAPAPVFDAVGRQGVASGEDRAARTP